MRYVKAAILAAAAAALSIALAQPARAEVSFDFAYSNLSQHGSWLVSGEYGRVWQPREYRRAWNPYYDGHWVDTEMGWTWVSDYSWGSIPYHYGTWVVDSRYGWVWIPGDLWAPSWVVFRTSPDYIGWAPVPPGFSVGLSMEFGAPSSFIYVSSRDFLAPRMRTAIIPAARTNVFINNTTIVNNIVIQNDVVINRGPDVRFVEKATGRTVRRQPIEQVTRVAPFEHVSRAQLAVTPERAKRGLRVAEPVPESRPLPVAGQRARPSDQGQRKTPFVAPAQDAKPKARDVQAPSKRVEPRQPWPQARTDAAAGAQKARHTETTSRDAAAASAAEVNSKAKAKVEQAAQAPAKARAKAGGKEKKDKADGNKQGPDKGNAH